MGWANAFLVVGVAWAFAWGARSFFRFANGDKP